MTANPEEEEYGLTASPQVMMNTTTCLKEEDLLQACIIKNHGLYGCDQIMERYNECRTQEMTHLVREQQRKENEEFRQRYKKLHE